MEKIIIIQRLLHGLLSLHLYRRYPYSHKFEYLFHQLKVRVREVGGKGGREGGRRKGEEGRRVREKEKERMKVKTKGV